MKTNVFDPEACDAARRAKIVVVSPTKHPEVEQSPRGQSALDPLYDLHRPENLPTSDAALAAGREQLRKRREQETAIAGQHENAARFAHRLGVPLEVATRLMEAEAEIFILNSQISSLMFRLGKLESKSK